MISELTIDSFFACLLLPPPAPVTSTTFPSKDRDIPARLCSPCGDAASKVATESILTWLTAGR